MILIYLIFTTLIVKAQEGQFSQFFASYLYLNPAFAGIQPGATLSSNYKRSQESADGSFHELYQVSFNYPLQKITTLRSQTGGLGITASNERVGFRGLYQTTKVLLTGAYVLPFDRRRTRKLSLALQGGIVQSRLNSEDFYFGSQYNPYIGYDNTLQGESLDFAPTYHPVFGVGALFSIVDHPNPILQQNALQVGMCIDYVNRPRYGFLVNQGNDKNDRQPMIFKVTGTSRFKLTPRYFIHPSALLITSQNIYQINVGTYFSTYMDQRLNTLLQIGTWYRYKDSFILLTGFQYRYLRFGVSFDLNSKIVNPNEVIYQTSFQPSYEVSLSYSFDFRNGPVNVINPLF